MRVLLIVLMLGMAQLSYAGFYDEHARGWFWYEDDIEEASHTPPKPPPVNLQNASAIMKEIEQQFNSAKDLALLVPSDENIKRLEGLQRRSMQAGLHLFENWELFKIHNPEYDESLRFPTSSTGRIAYDQQKRKGIDRALKKLSERMGFIFLYDPNCTFCQQMAPILKRFAARYGFKVLPLTRRGDALPSWQDSTQKDRGQFAQFEVTYLPSLVLVDSQTQKAVAKLSGLQTEDKLIETLIMLIQGKK